MYVYIKTEKGGETWTDGLGRVQETKPLWTVGFYAHDGYWHSESDHSSAEAAAARVSYLNGGRDDGKWLATMEARLLELNQRAARLEDEVHGLRAFKAWMRRSTPATGDAMERHGGHFASQLAKAWRWADATNDHKLTLLFGDLLLSYRQFLRDGVLRP